MLYSAAMVMIEDPDLIFWYPAGIPKHIYE